VPQCGVFYMTLEQEPNLAPVMLIVIGNSHVAGAVFRNDVLAERMLLDIKTSRHEEVEQFLRNNQDVSYALICSINGRIERKITEILHRYEVPYSFTRDHTFALSLNTDEPEKVASDRIADMYGALRLYPGNSVIVNISTTVTFDVVSADGKFIGGVIYPGLDMSARAMAQQTDQLPYVDINKPQHCGATTTKGNICCGIYYGLLGAVEKILSDLKKEYFPNEEVSTLVTGSSIIFMGDDVPHNALAKELRRDLSPLVDDIEPFIALIGLNEMVKEILLNQQEH